LKARFPTNSDLIVQTIIEYPQGDLHDEFDWDSEPQVSGIGRNWPEMRMGKGWRGSEVHLFGS